MNEINNNLPEALPVIENSHNQNSHIQIAIPINSNIPVEVIVGNEETININKCCKIIQMCVILSLIIYLIYYTLSIF